MNPMGPNHYIGDAYLTEQRFLTFRFILMHVLRGRYRVIADVGMGSGILAHLLISQGIKVTTVDSDPELRPDVQLDLRELGTLNRSYDCVICSQVLEHLPFGEFRRGVLALIRAATREVIITVPDRRYYVQLDWKLPGLIRNGIRVDLPFPMKRWVDDHPEHHWEMNCKPFTEKKVISSLVDACRIETWKLAEHGRIPGFPYHHFFFLRPDSHAHSPRS
jgi:hypothetical protein